MDDCAVAPKSDNQHSAEDDARLLAKAHEIHRDKKRLKAVRMHHKNLSDALGANAGSMATKTKGRKKRSKGRGMSRY